MKLSDLFKLLLIIMFAISTSELSGQSASCDAYPFIPPLLNGQFSNGTIPVPCGFDAGGFYVNECSPCGFKIADDDCVNTPLNSLCQLDGFQTAAIGRTNDVFQPALGFCGQGTATHNNCWIGFIAQSNSVALEISTSNCTNPNNLGMQFAICETNCIDAFNVMSNNGQAACIGIDANQSGLFNDTAILTANNLIPGNPYYLMADAFAGPPCDLQLNVLDGFGDPELDINITPSGELCVDVLNPGDFTNQMGATVTVNLNNSTSREFTFLWQDPNGELIASTSGEIISDSFVRGTLEGNFFTSPGIHTLTILDDATCCTLCSDVELVVVDPVPVALGITSAGIDEINCQNASLTLEAIPEDGSVPAVEQWMVLNNSDERIILISSIVATNGRVNELEITTDLIQQHYPGQQTGEATFIYGFLSDFNEICLNEGFILIPFDFSLNDPNNPDVINCLTVSTSFLVDADIDIFPNPNNGSFQISFDADLTLERVSIFNINGQLVKEITNTVENKGLNIHATGLPSGTYFIEAQFQQGVYRQKMVISK